MLYYLIRPIVRIALRIFFKKITLSHVERIPKNKAVILAANHPTAFLEPIILACYLDRSLIFLVRGDIWVKPFVMKILRSLHLLPVYRKKDRGYSFIKKTFETLEYCYNALANKKTVMILAEGTTIHGKRIQPIQKGTARLAFGGIDANPDLEDIHIIPVGVNYTYATKARKQVCIDFGESISTKAYYRMENRALATKKITQKLENALKARHITIQNKEDDEIAEMLLSMFRLYVQPQFWPKVGRNDSALLHEKKIADYVNSISKEQKQALLSTLHSLANELAKEGLKLEDLPKKNAQKAYWLLYIIAQPARWLARPINRIAHHIIDTKVNEIEFNSSIELGVSTILYLFISILAVILGWIYSPWIIVLAFVLGIWMYWGQIYHEQYEDASKAKLLKQTRVNLSIVEAIKSDIFER